MRWAPGSDVVVPLPHSCGLPEKKSQLCNFVVPVLGPPGGPTIGTSGLNIERKRNHLVVPKTGTQFRYQVLTKSGQQFGPTAAPWSAYRAPSAAHGRGDPRSVRPSAVASAMPASVHGLHALLRVAETCARGSATRCSLATSSTMLVVGATPCCRFVRCTQWTRRCSSKNFCARTAAQT